MPWKSIVNYGQNIMSEGAVKQWCRIFKDGWSNIHNEGQSDWPSVVSDDLVQSERWCFTISELSCEFPQILCTIACTAHTYVLFFCI
jgi:hypothetical protein